jgi:hypothetical protein
LGSSSRELLILYHPWRSSLQSRQLCRSSISFGDTDNSKQLLTTIKNRGDSLLDLPNLETSSSALEEKSTRSAATYQLYFTQGQEKLTRDPSSIPQHLTLGTSTPNIKIITHKLPHSQQTKSPPLLPSSQDFMSIIPLSSVNKSLLLSLPESLDFGCCFVLSSYVCSPGSLDTTGHCMPILVPFTF